MRFEIGSLVTVRNRDWVVLPGSVEDFLVLRPLGGSDDDVAAVFPALEQVRAAEFQRPSADDLGDSHAAGLLRTALRIGFRSGAGPFRSLAGIAVEPRPYQLVPLLMALRQETVRLLISDDVGIGKTIEAGLIASELLAQGDANGLAVLCSPALAEQWQGELRTKFGIDAELILASTVPGLERGLDLGQSLFDKYRNVVVSTDFIKSHRHRDEFIRHCPDLVIVDEAHTSVAADSAQGNQQGQLRYQLLQNLAAAPNRHLVLVTATPHSGKEEAFQNLLGLLDPKLAGVDRSAQAGRQLVAQHFIQRRRADIRHYLNEDTEFPDDRFFKDEPYKLTGEYRALFDHCLDYSRERLRTASGQREVRTNWWSALALLRSLASSPRAAAATLTTRAATVAAGTEAEVDAVARPAILDSGEGDQLEGVDAVPGTAEGGDPTLLGLAKSAKALESPEKDAKLKLLIKQVKALTADGYHPIVFCRFIPTAEYVAEHLGAALGRNSTVEAVTGTLSPQQRIDRIESLHAATEDDPAARRVLVATDCLSEGVNLQHSFNAVIHYDLAWNPVRHEQREGRVDRFGQRSPDVRVITIFGDDNGIDGKVLEILVKKHREIRKATGVSVPVPDETSESVTNAIFEWLLMRDQAEQPMLELEFDNQAAQLDIDWNSTAERETQSRSRYAQGTIRPDDVAREVKEVRDALGTTREVRGFVREALTALRADVTGAETEGDFTATTSPLPMGLRDSLRAVLGDRRGEERPDVQLRTNPAVPRGEIALVRTDPAVGAVARFVLDSALDKALPEWQRPARRSGVITTRDVTTRTTLLLVRYRFHLTLPSRGEEQQLVAEDARLLAFEGSPAKAVWLDDAQAAALLDAKPSGNTAAELAETASSRVIDNLADLVPHLEQRGDQLAAELRESHRRVREAVRGRLGGIKVIAQKPADVLGAYVYLPGGGA
ncbi:superfamily II DNA or RNA helicase [Catenulispora sp. GAS73]|uniref:helicase-related protein n=1 Tax=Catenulispora sp. GAS73 TaxID=3156269 RepID=UPI00351760EF